MSLKDLSQGDFTFYKKYAGKMRDCHETEFLKQIDPELQRAFYRGRNKKESTTDEQGYYYSREHFLALSRIFQGTNTLLPNIYYQNPAPIVIPQRQADPNSAALMSAALKHYMKVNEGKKQNQEAVLNAWFFGIGWKKIGYHTSFAPRVQEPETQLGPLDQVMNAGKALLGMKPDNNETKERPDIVEYEGLYNNSESPMNIMLDHKADLANCKVILHRLPRTLNDLENFGDYDEATLKEYFDKNKRESGSRLDSRDVDLWLNEMHIQQRNGVWILTWIENFDKPLRYEKSTYQGKGFQFSPLVMTNEPGVRYPISHMRVATQVQEQLDYLATLYVRIIDRVRNQVLINQNDLAPGQKKAIEANILGSTVFTNKPISSGTYAQLTSAAVSNDLPQLMSIVQQNLTEIIGADEQMVSGTSKNKTLGQDELARVGSKIRESGIIDRVRDWMIDQFKKEGTILKQYSNGELHLQITGKDYSNPMTGQTVEQQWVSFMTPDHPLGLKQYLQGDFDYEVSVEEALKPDKKSQQEQLEKLILTSSNPEIKADLLEDGYKVKTAEIYKVWAGTFDGLGTPDPSLATLAPMQVAAIQAKQVIMQNGGQVPGAVTQQDMVKAKQKDKEAKPDGEVSNKSSEAAQI